MSELGFLIIGIIVGFSGGYAFYKKNGKKVEAKLAEAEAKLIEAKAALEKLKG